MSALPLIRYEKVETYSIAGIQFTCVSKWNGFEEWKDAKGRKLIVHRDRWVGFAGAFGDVFPGLAQGEAAVIAGTPDLIADLAALQAQSAATAAAPKA